MVEWQAKDGWGNLLIGSGPQVAILRSAGNNRIVRRGIIMAANLKALPIRARKLLRWLVAAIILYTVLGFLVLPLIIRHVAIKQLSQQLGREVAIKQVKFNPYVFSTTIRGLMIKDRDGEPFVSWDEVYVNFQLSSFFGRAWVFKEISITRPYARVQMNKDYSFNFSDLIAKFSTNSVPAKPVAASKPLMLRVAHLDIGQATVSLTDFTPKEPFKRTLGPIDIDLKKFGTDPDNKNPYSFAGTTDAGEQIAWSGFFYLSPLRSGGTLSLSDFSLNKYAPLYEDLVRFQIRNGVIGLRVNYLLELNADKCTATLNDTSLTLRDLELAEPGQSNDIVSLPLFSVKGVNLDVQRRQLEVGSVVAAGAKLSVQRNHDNQINVVQLAQPIETNEVSGGVLFLLRSVTNAVAMLLNSTNQWSGMVRDIDVTNCSVHLEDKINSRPARLDLDDIALTARNLSNLSGTNLSADLSLRWNTNGAIRVKVAASLEPLVAKVRLDLDELDLGSLDPYLEPKLNLFILGSRAGLHGEVQLQAMKNQLPVVTFAGDVRLDGFHAVDGIWAEDLLKWDSVRLNGIEANLNPSSLHIKELDLDNVYARIIIESNRTVNLLNALRLTNSASTTVSNNNTVPVAGKAAPAARGLPDISIGQIVLSNAVINFTDRSVKPSVHLGIEQANGTISGLASAELMHADLNLGALVDGVGPVSVTGNINPFNQQYTNHVKISLHDMDLTPTSPYAGKFAGYDIAEGKLSLDLIYDMVGHNLTSKNVITLDQFTFGDAVNSPDATHLPVRLAIAILKDRNGKIVLDVPIEGSLDDPKFRISKVVTRALVNILEKVATSPFSLLGAVFGGGGEELGYQDFNPGSAELTDVDRKKLDSLAKGLYQRPALKLAIAGSVEPAADREGVQRAKLDQMIRDRKWQAMRQDGNATNSVDELTLTPEEREAGLKSLYDEFLASGKITPEMIAANTNLAAYANALASPKNDNEKGATQLMDTRTTENPTTVANTSVYKTRLLPPPSPTEAALFMAISVEPADLVKLAEARTRAVQSYLIRTSKVEPGRFFIINVSTENLRATGSRVYLQFE